MGLSVLIAPTREPSCSGKQQEANCSFKAIGRNTWVTIEAFTSRQDRADTRGAVYASFELYGLSELMRTVAHPILNTYHINIVVNNNI